MGDLPGRAGCSTVNEKDNVHFTIQCEKFSSIEMEKGSRRRSMLKRAHHDYRESWTFPRVIGVLETPAESETTSIRAISRESNIPFETLRRWCLNLNENPDWMP
jgi:hypothetical protein